MVMVVRTLDVMVWAAFVCCSAPSARFFLFGFVLQWLAEIASAPIRTTMSAGSQNF